MPLATIPRLFAALIVAAGVGRATPARAVNHPFGSHPLGYVAGAILPGHVPPSALDQAVRDFYDAWKQRYLVQTCGPGRYVVAANVINSANLTVSEAHGYGMIVTALMAGHDPEARAIFDGMYAYFREHPSIFFPHLMAWYQRKTCGSAEGGDSASDGDLDIAYALLLADKQWGSCGAIDYATEAAAVLGDIAAGEVDASGTYLKLGDWATPTEPQYYAATRTSDFMPGHLRTFAAVTTSPLWTTVLDQGYLVFDALQTTFAPATGLLPDFVADPAGTPQPVAPFFLEGPNDGAYDYNACRDPWRVATDYLLSGDARAKTTVDRITSWFRAATGDDPGAIRAGYQLDGTLSAGADFRSLAFVAPLGVAAMTDAANQGWLEDIWDLVVATSIDDERYYENTLKLLAMITMSGNWWAPELVSGGCTPVVTPVCTNGGVIADVQLKLAGLAAPPGRQKLVGKGTLFFPQGIPTAAPYTDGAQLLIEDLGGATVLIELTHLTNPVPPIAAGACDPARDGWQVKPTSTTYRNRSGSLDPPVCTAGSAAGLSQLRYRHGSPRDLGLQIKIKGAAFPAPTGPVRATVVLGSTATDGAAGRCAVSTELTCSGGPGSLRCR